MVRTVILLVRIFAAHVKTVQRHLARAAHRATRPVLGPRVLPPGQMRPGTVITRFQIGARPQVVTSIIPCMNVVTVQEKPIKLHTLWLTIRRLIRTTCQVMRVWYLDNLNTIIIHVVTVKDYRIMVI